MKKRILKIHVEMKLWYLQGPRGERDSYVNIMGSLSEILN